MNKVMSFGQMTIGGLTFTVKGRTQPLLAPEQVKKETVMGWTPGVTSVPAGGDWLNNNGPQP